MRVPLMTMRDKKVLLELDDFGLMTSAQIKERVFAETRIRTVLRRLRILEKQKLIQRVYGLKGGALAWTVTSLGLKVIGPTKDASHVNKNTLEHDILFNEIRLSMERSGVTGKWRSGHSLRHSASANKQPWMRETKMSSRTAS